MSFYLYLRNCAPIFVSGWLDDPEFWGEWAYVRSTDAMTRPPSGPVIGRFRANDICGWIQDAGSSSALTIGKILDVGTERSFL